MKFEIYLFTVLHNSNHVNSSVKRALRTKELSYHKHIFLHQILSESQAGFHYIDLAWTSEQFLDKREKNSFQNKGDTDWGREKKKVRR